MNKEKESPAKPKDDWDKLEIIAKLGIAFVIPIITAAATFFITKHQTAPAAIDLAAKIYAAPNCDGNESDRTYCRSPEMDDLANHLISTYLDFEIEARQGSISPALINPGGRVSQQFCVDVCEKEPDSTLCKYQCPFWPQK